MDCSDVIPPILYYREFIMRTHSRTAANLMLILIVVILSSGYSERGEFTHKDEKGNVYIVLTNQGVSHIKVFPATKSDYITKGCKGQNQFSAGSIIPCQQCPCQEIWMKAPQPLLQNHKLL